jgi:hypothetical protein
VSILTALILIDKKILKLGKIPEEFYGIRALKVLDVSRNVLTGRVSDRVGYMEFLVVLAINDNRLTG